MRPFSKRSESSSSSDSPGSRASHPAAKRRAGDPPVVAAGEAERLSENLASEDPEIVSAAVRALKRRLPVLTGADYRRAVEAVCSLFYIDTADKPDLEEALEAATRLLADQGLRTIPILLAQMQTSDIKSHIYLARTLGRMGPIALPKLRDLLATSEDPYARAFALYAIGKMTCPQVARAIPEALGGLMHPDKEVRDTAARTLGKIAQVVPAGRLTPRRRREMFEGLLRAARDPQAPVRAKAMRSLGKLAAGGLLNRAQKGALGEAARAALGESDEYGWDNSYIVRREAKETLQALEGH